MQIQNHEPGKKSVEAGKRQIYCHITMGINLPAMSKIQNCSTKTDGQKDKVTQYLLSALIVKNRERPEKKGSNEVSAMNKSPADDV